tara:strand:- start:39 stop:434 length:396 start_codon:yes stop_codon:yes gene_type:complete
MAGTIIADTLTHSTAGSVTTDFVVNGSAKAWVNFNGTGTIADNDSFNLSTLTDSGTGIYRTNFTNAMSNVHHCNSFACRENTTTNGGDINRFVNYNRQISSASYTDLTTQTSGTTPVDLEMINVVTHGDLA